jgi:trans-aconitate 2-methyltransferase
MPTWNPKQYLKFDEERTQPCRDLIARINLKDPRRIADLGCGPGNSTAALAQRWPAATLTGIDNSADMIDAARNHHPHVRWQQGDVAEWIADEPFDLVFSNAALQWVGDHARVMPRLFEQVAPGGAFAWQVPANMDAPAHRLMRDLAASATWRTHFAGTVREWFVHGLSFYYDLLAPRTARLELWKTEYLHIMESPAAIVEWYKGTGLRPFLDQLPGQALQQRFLANYAVEIETAYPRQPDGRVLFPFLRQFAVAYRG